MNLNNITGKLTRNADKIGILVGAGARGIDPLINNVMAILSGRGHIPDIARTVKAYFELPEFRPTVMLWLGGYVAKEFGYGKIGNPLQKFSEGMLKGLAIQHVLWWSTHAHEGSAPRSMQDMYNKSVGQPNMPTNVNPMQGVYA